MDRGKMLTAQEAADALGYHVNHLYRLLAQGIVKGERFHKAWVIDPAEVSRIKALQNENGRRDRIDRLP